MRRRLRLPVRMPRSALGGRRAAVEAAVAGARLMLGLTEPRGGTLEAAGEAAEAAVTAVTAVTVQTAETAVTAATGEIRTTVVDAAVEAAMAGAMAVPSC